MLVYIVNILSTPWVATIKVYLAAILVHLLRWCLDQTLALRLEALLGSSAGVNRRHLENLLLLLPCAVGLWSPPKVPIRYRDPTIRNYSNVHARCLYQRTMCIPPIAEIGHQPIRFQMMYSKGRYKNLRQRKS